LASVAVVGKEKYVTRERERERARAGHIDNASQSLQWRYLVARNVL